MPSDEQESRQPAGGSGGGPTTSDHNQFFDGGYAVSANRIDLLSRPPDPPAVPDKHVITVLAAGLGIDGRVCVRGTQGVRITGGPPPLPPTDDEGTNGVEIAVGEIQNVTIQRGLIPGVDQKIEMTPTGITVDGGAMPITVQSLSEIKLAVAGGVSSITLTPAGIVLQGIIIQIN
jgi:hypothetical protein